jgi:hypothetical protein
MDGTQFDTLIKRLGTRSLTRSTALRGLAATVAALAGVTLAAEPSAAKEKRKVCHCTDEKSTSCKTLEVRKKAVRRHVKNHPCDYRRECKDVSGCCFGDTQTCTTDAQCCSKECGDGVCRPARCASMGESCASLSCCTGTCIEGACRVPGSCITQGSGCGQGTPQPCCTGVCHITGGTNGLCAPCRTAGETCVGGPAPAQGTCCTGLACSAATGGTCG